MTKYQPDPKADLGRYTWPKVRLIQSVTKCQPDPKPDHGVYIWPKVSLTQNVTKCQPDPKPDGGGMSDQRSAWPEDLTKCQPDLKPYLFWVLLTKWKKDIWKFEHTLHFRSCFTEVFSMKPNVCIYVCMCVCVKIECRKQRMIEKVFQMQEIFDRSHQKNPCYRSLMRICQHGAKIFNKTCSFEVSIGMLPLILNVSSKESLLLRSCENLSRSSWGI